MVQVTERPPHTLDRWESHPPHDVDEVWMPLLVLSLLPLALGIIYGLAAVAGLLALLGVYLVARRVISKR